MEQPAAVDNHMAAQEEEKKGEEFKLDEETKSGRQPHHEPQLPGLTDNDIDRQYEKCIREAAGITVCNYAGLNMAISLGFAGRNDIASDANNDKFSAKRG